MMPELNRIYCGDCWKELDKFDSNFFDSVVCDPPYELGFMGKSWDSTGIAYNVRMWTEVKRVLKPGAHLLAFGGTRTYHRMACAIEDAGFEIRDQMQWLYGSGFPKSLDVSKAIDKAAGAERECVGKRRAGIQNKGRLIGGKELEADKMRDVTKPATPEANEWDGWGTALKPANEPICLARKPLSESTVAANVLKWGTGAMNIDGCRIEYEATQNPATNPLYRKMAGYKNGYASDENSSSFSMKDGKGERNPNTKGRWPANVIHDGSEEVLDGFPHAPGQCGEAQTDGTPKNNKIFGAMKHGTINSVPRADDSKSAARFFYCAKTSPAERGEGNTHPTVKPIVLLSYLVRLITPPRGIVLDPFLGSGSTALAAMREGHPWVGIELIESHVAIAHARVDAERAQGKLF